MKAISLKILKALLKQYEGNYEMAKANVAVYMDNMVGIGEHPDLAEAVDSQILLMVEAKDKIDMVKLLLEESE